MELLEYLKGKYVLCAASNGPLLQQQNRLRVGGMLDYFSYLFISEEIGFAKPSPEFFQVCMQRLNEEYDGSLLPTDVMIIGDSLSSDIAGGKGFGLQTLYYNPQKKLIPAEIHPDCIVNSLAEIKNIL